MTPRRLGSLIRWRILGAEVVEEEETLGDGLKVLLFLLLLRRWGWWLVGQAGFCC